ncbi:hypothetical protein [Mycolicibacter arupensis]|uniref:hypothetical protein n=1 Tax=Mycolicibacter arupensis TaxID=342002 RepID=UPI00122D0CA0|nr:hypothetical protein [Mycolicibacter arupensis]KAA1428624.1 hypothetical protein F0402_19030 [Mycolicibacter arupensis]
MQDGKLLSPLSPYPVELPASGVLENAYFVPGIEEIRSTVAMIQDRRWYDVAVSFGRVTGPLVRDPDMPRIGSMQCASYTTERIYARDAVVEQLSGNYDVPVTSGFAF